MIFLKIHFTSSFSLFHYVTKLNLDYQFAPSKPKSKKTAKNVLFGEIEKTIFRLKLEIFSPKKV